LHSGPSLFVENLQQGSGTHGGSARKATQLGDAGCMLTQEDGQESARNGEADPLGLGAGGEVGLQVGTDVDTAALGLL
jgi:hypothetical protein